MKAPIRKTMAMDRDKLRRARRILGAKNDTQTVDQALAIVIANQEIESAIGEYFGAASDLDVR
jgi:hypothetical protein